MEFTKEQLIEHINGRKEFADECAADSTLHPERREYYELTAEAMRIALASLEAEPVAWTDEDELRDAKNGGSGYMFAIGGDANKFADPRRQVMLYTAPPAPVIQETADREILKRLAVILSGSDAPGEIRSLTVTARSFVDRCKTLAKERDDCRAAMLQGAEPVTTAYKMPEETGSSLQLRNLIRQRHAEWSQATFGDVGPIGTLKHLSKEALEAAAEPDDLSEWADMQFLLWDAQHRAGISDGEITAAMEEKLKVNMARNWPEPKDGEPRLHIKAAPQQEVKKCT